MAINVEKLVQAALKVREKAYAPYSNFKVGAALLSKSGTIYSGVNVENSSFGATICAERNALFNAVTNGDLEFDAIVIASNLNGKAVYPCGMCRQVLSDFSKEMNVIIVNSETEEIEAEVTLSKLFPNSFDF